MSFIQLSLAPLLLLSLLNSEPSGFASAPDTTQAPLRCGGCEWDPTSMGSESKNIDGTGCTMKIKKTRTAFNNDDCTNSHSNCGDKKCTFTWEVEMKFQGTCGNASFSLSGANWPTSNPATTITSAWTTVYMTDDTQGESGDNPCGSKSSHDFTITGTVGTTTTSLVSINLVGCEVCTSSATGGGDPIGH